MNRLLQRLAAFLLLVIVATAPALAAVPAPDLVPLRVVAEAAGAELKWNAETQTATITTRDGAVIVVSIGQTKATVDGQEVPVGRPVELVDGTTMVAASFLNNALGVPVTYNAAKGTATVDPKMELSRDFVKALVAGDLSGLQEQFSPGLAKALTPETAALMVQTFGQFGKPGRPVVTVRSFTGVHTNVDVATPFERVLLKVTVRFNAAGLIDDFTILPFQVPMAAGSPSYADPSSFLEKEVVIGAESEWPLPATLSLPIAKGPFPAVVLVHGSGANDRDETLLGAKPFRDLAEGLASRGIAVLRYDKRTLVHAAKASTIEKLTMQQETVDDALVAVKYLAEQPGIDPSRIFVIGHSQGGLALPRILQQDADKLIRGGVMMAAPNDFLKILIEQNKLLVQTNSAPPQQLAFFEQQLAMVMDPAFNPEQPPEGWALGSPYFWLDAKAKASVLLKEQTQPILMLQGQRDYQVQVSEIDSFKADLAERTNITYKIYPKLNHFFTEGEGELSTPREYATPANVPLYVIEDILTWMNAQ